MDRIRRAELDLPLLRAVRDRFSAARPLAGARLAVSSRLSMPAALAVRILAAGGAEVAACASNPLAVDDDLVAALSADGRVAVHARRGQSPAEQASGQDAALATNPDLVIDHGADLTQALWSRRQAVAAAIELMAAAVPMLHRAAAAGRLAWPVVDASREPGQLTAAPVCPRSSPRPACCSAIGPSR